MSTGKMNERSKRKYVAMQTKLEAIRRLDGGETIKKLAGEYGVGEVTVGDWRRNRSKIEQFCSQMCSDHPLQQRRSMKKSEYEKTSEALLAWFVQQKRNGLNVTEGMMQERALLFRNEFQEGEGDFTASVGWLDRWKKRYGIRQLNISGSSFLEKFIKKFMDKEDSSGYVPREFDCEVLHVDKKSKDIFGTLL